jgi:hypothetical protein
MAAKEVESVGTGGLLRDFATRGNPFLALIHSGADEAVEQTGGAHYSALHSAAPGAELIALLQAEMGKSASSRRDKDGARSMVVTQAALNGLAKYTVKYLNMMVLVPTAASEMLDNLLQLFDYYLCSAFCGFVPSEDRAKFLAPANKLNAAAPDLSRAFEVLCAYQTLLLARS